MNGPDRSVFTLHTDDGVLLSARWRHPATGPGDPERRPATAVVVSHGFGSCMDNRSVTDLCEALATGGYGVLAYDSRGHGRSGGECTLGYRERLDVAAAVRHAGGRGDRIVLVGESMGGIAVLNHLAERGPTWAGPVAGAVLVSTPAVWEMPRNVRGLLSVAATRTSLGRAVMARWWGTTVARRPGRGEPPVELIQLVACSVALVHGADDRFIAASAAWSLRQAARPPRSIDVVAGMGHGYGPAAIERIGARVRWVTRCNGVTSGAETTTE